MLDDGSQYKRVVVDVVDLIVVVSVVVVSVVVVAVIVASRSSEVF